MKRRYLIALLIILVPPAVYYVYYRWAGEALSPETLTALGAITVIAAGWVAFAKNLTELWAKLTGKGISPPRPPDFPFTIVREPDKVLTTLFGESPNPLADDKLDYQVRQASRDITAELRQALETPRRVLLRSASGVGKTREIGELARQLVEEGYTLLVHDKHDRLLTPVRFPPELVNTRNLLFVFDDLHDCCAPPAEGAGGAEEFGGRETFHDRLQRFLEQAVKRFGRREVNVLAAARRERELWPHLRWESHPLWRGFYLYELPAPDEDAQARFLRDVADRGQVKVPEADVERIAQANDRTFRNLLENVRRSRPVGQLTAETFLPYQGKTFEQTYAELRKAYPRLIPLLWDALYLLRAVGLPAQSRLTADLAARLGRPGGALLRWRARRRLLVLTADLVADGHLTRAAETEELTVQEDLLAAKGELPDPVQRFDDLWAAVQRAGTVALPLWYDLASYADDRGHAAVAERICRAILRREREHIAALNLLALATQGQGRSRESIAYLERVRALAQEQGDKQAEGVVLGNLGLAYANLGQVERAIEYHQQALAISREIGDRRGEGSDLGNLGAAYYRLGQVAQAMEHYQQALAIAREIGDRSGEGNRLGNLGLAYAALGQVERAIEYYQQALAISREIGDRRGEGNSLGNLGLAYADLGQVEKAIEHHQQALVISREIGDRRGEGSDLGNLGLAYAALGQVERAIEYHQQALAIAQEIGDRRGEGSDLSNLGNAYADLGQVERAIEYYQQALAISREIGDRRGEGSDLGNLGNAYAGLGQVERAIEYYEQALDISREIGDPRGEGNHLGNLGLAYADLGQVERAIEYHQQALEIAREIGDRHMEGSVLGNLGLAYADLGQVDKAIEYYQQALEISQEIGDRRGEASDLANLGQAYRQLGQVKKARELWLEALPIFEEIKSPQAETVRGWLETTPNDQ